MNRQIIFIGIVLFVFFLLWVQVTQPIYQFADKKDLPTADAEKLRNHVRTISKGYFPRDYRSPETLGRLAEYIQQVFVKANGRTQLQTFVVDGKPYHNVIASYGPEEGERIIVGAHYDTAGQFPGANDNASGVAGLMALANLLKEAKLSTRVDLVAFTLEEPPFFRTPSMGSAHYVRLLKSEEVRVRIMFSLETIGYFDDKQNSQKYPIGLMNWFYPDKANFIAVVGKFLEGSRVRKIKSAMKSANDLPVYSINAPATVPGVDFSDHVNFWSAGYPAVMITDTAFFRYDEYHLAGDTYDRLDYVRMAKVIQGVYAAVLSFQS